MALTSRARSYLVTLERRPAVPLARVVEALARAGCPPLAPWLDFHERYAGIVDPLGRDEAVLGLVHAAPYWRRANEVDVDEEGGERQILCAEVHGSYDYTLDESGAFRSYGGGGPCVSFDVKVEQDAVIWDAKRDGRAWMFAWKVTRVPPVGLGPLRELVKAEAVPEASDRFSTVWRGRDATWREAGEVLMLVVAKEAWEGIARVVGVEA